MDLKKCLEHIPAWDIKQKVIIDMAADRGAFIDQSQSINIFVAAPTVNLLLTTPMVAWLSHCRSNVNKGAVSVDKSAVSSFNTSAVWTNYCVKKL